MTLINTRTATYDKTNDVLEETKHNQTEKLKNLEKKEQNVCKLKSRLNATVPLKCCTVLYCSEIDTKQGNSLAVRGRVRPRHISTQNARARACVCGSAAFVCVPVVYVLGSVMYAFG